MAEKIAPAVRSRMMASIRSKNTAPERIVRRLLHAMGYRFRLHRNALPGKPDIVLPRHTLAILVHGCFWHRHPGCRYCTSPKSNIPFWQEKFAANVRRDKLALVGLRNAGWRTLVVWECCVKAEAKDAHRLPRLLQQAIESKGMHTELPRIAPSRPKKRS